MTNFYLIAFYLLDWQKKKKILFQVWRIWSPPNVVDLSVNLYNFFGVGSSLGTILK